MTPEAAIATAGLVAFALVALVAAISTRRILNGAGRNLITTSARLEQAAGVLPERLDSARSQLKAINAEAERGLWAMATFDNRSERASAALVEGRVTSDALRARLVDNRIALARLRETGRLVLQAIKLRRAFLG